MKQKVTNQFYLKRVTKGMTQEELAAKAGVSRATVVRAEGGEMLAIKSYNALCNALGLPTMVL